MSSNSTILGDSWVVEAAATPPPNKPRQAPNAKQLSNSPAPRATADQTKKTPSSPSETRTSDYGPESIATSVSSISGPELIMPSIYESPVPEASWIAPNVRLPGQTVKRRHHRSERAQPNPSNASPRKDRNPRDHEQDRPQDHQTQNETDNNNNNNKPPSPLHRLEPTLRALLNALLIALIAHLLVFPELISQHQTFFCAIPSIPALYPSSCSPPHFHFPDPLQSTSSSSSTTKTNPPPRTHEEKLTLHATRLERLFTTTLTTLTPLHPLLKQNESRLRALQTDLRASFRGSRHELELEFSGLWEAARAGSRKLDSLTADLRSAVDNLIATGITTTADGAAAPAEDVSGGGEGGWGRRGGGGHEAAHANAKAQARAAQITSAQLSRREGYLDQLTSRMQGKADALASDLATVEDHLESIERIILREARSSFAPPSSQTQQQEHEHEEQERNQELPPSRDFLSNLPLLSHLPRLGTLGGLGAPRGVRQDASSRASSGPSSSKHEAFVAATTGHRAVAEAVRNLSQRLDALQRRKN